MPCSEAPQPCPGCGGAPIHAPDSKECAIEREERVQALQELLDAEDRAELARLKFNRALARMVD